MDWSHNRLRILKDPQAGQPAVRLSPAQYGAAIHIQNFAVDMSRPFCAQKDNWPPNVLGRRHPADWDGGFQRLTKAVPRKCVSTHIGINPPRRD